MANRWSKLGSYHSNETYSDLTVVTDDNETFRLHRIVVSTISAYFEKEANSQTFHLPGIDSNVFRQVIEFIYSGTYTEYISTDLHPHPQALERVTPEDFELQLMTLGDFLGAAGRVRNVVAGSQTTHGPEHEFCHNMAHWAWDIEFPSAAFASPYRDRIGKYKITDFLSHLEQSAVLYTTAERLLMPELKILTLRRFGFFAAVLEQYSKALSSLEVTHLSNIARHIYSGTTSTDLAIKEPLCRIIHHFKQINLQTSLYPIDSIARKYPDFSRGLLSYQSIQLRYPGNVLADDGPDEFERAWKCDECDEKFAPNQQPAVETKQASQHRVDAAGKGLLPLGKP
ncbi:hypothetical protein PgNI_06435 [Pyricularia grisea]|uniref:BTB domain-containing protein n=1 Tax=Pyricularia grisea TaxID=148305 RepID=A0A6P8B5X6_PYRGI|nr:hypothetical protein PgNI_06435 [Pyricularia grisea]TLD10668.1 hypothetical protein PgNI_06435 [Pyricularia grisea]